MSDNTNDAAEGWTVEDDVLAALEQLVLAMDPAGLPPGVRRETVADLLLMRYDAVSAREAARVALAEAEAEAADAIARRVDTLLDTFGSEEDDPDSLLRERLGAEAELDDLDEEDGSP